MAERRRIIPASVGPLVKDQNALQTPPALRLQLDLTSTTEENCTEFAYPVLVKNVAGGDAKDAEQKTFNDIHEEDLASLEEIARKFEEKYNAPGKKGKKKRLILEDLIDAGMGYDESDPFVDNSECYDELVPASLTTQFGGFYINSGPLKFKEIVDSDDGDFHSKKIKTPKKKKKFKLENGDAKKERKVKRKLSSDSGGTGDHMTKKARKQLKKKLREEKKLRRKKGPRMIRTPTVAELLKRNASGSPGSPQQPATSSHNGPVSSATAPTPSTQPPAQHPTQPPSKHPTAPAPQGVVTSSGGREVSMDMSLDLGISMDDLNMDKDMLDVMAMMNGSDSLGVGVAGVSGGGGDADSDLNVSPSGPTPGGEDGGSKEVVELPVGLPTQLLENIEKIKEAARKSVEGKTKFFNSYVNGLLLRIEHGTRTLNCGKRSAVYYHLANHLPCTKLTLQKRAKKLQLGAQDNQLKEPLQRLREAIVGVMPQQEMRFKAERQEAALKADLQPSLNAEGKVIEHKPPKKKFVWDERLRRLLCEVVKVKVKTFEISKSRTQSAEEYLKAFLDSEVKPLWPKDWIQTRNLFKESRSVHDHVTSLAAKQRKAMAGGPRKLVLTAKKDGSDDGEGPSTNHAPSAADAQEGEPSSTQVSDMVGSPITAKHLADVPTLLDYSGDDSMEAAITSSQFKGTEPSTASSDSNQDVSPMAGPSHNAVQDIPASSSPPLPALDPSFYVDQLISQQLVSNSLQDVGGGMDVAQSTTAPGTGYGQSAVNKSGELPGAPVQGELVSKTPRVQKTGQSEGVSSRDQFVKQIGTEFDSGQQSYAAKLSAISNIHSMRTMHNQKSGVQAKDVTSSSGTVMAAKRAGVQKRNLSQPVVRLQKDNNIEKLTTQPSSRMRLQASHSKGLVSSSVSNAHNHQGAVHSMTYAQSVSNSSIQGRPNVSNPRMVGGGASDMLPQASSQAVLGNGSSQVSPSSQTTSHHVAYANQTISPQRASNAHSPGSAFSSPPKQIQHSHHMKGQSPTSRTQQTSPSATGTHKYSPTSQQYPAHQQYNSGHTSPIAAAYSTSPTYPSMAASSYQQIAAPDLAARQSLAGGNYGNSFPLATAQSTSPSSVSQSTMEAAISHPPQGTYFQQGDTRYVGDSSSNQHRIH